MLSQFLALRTVSLRHFDTAKNYRNSLASQTAPPGAFAKVRDIIHRRSQSLLPSGSHLGGPSDLTPGLTEPTGTLAAILQPAPSVHLLGMRLQNPQRCDKDLMLDACVLGSLPDVAALLNGGATANIKGHYGRTPLMSAVDSGNSLLLKMLLEAKADVNAADIKGTTALFQAAKKINQANTNLLAAGSLACPEETDVPDENYVLLQMLLEAGADVNSADREGTTALHLAVAKGDLALLQLLCAQRTVNLGYRTDVGEHHTARMLAEFLGRTRAAQFLAECENERDRLKSDAGA